ncbi:pac2 cAMP-independent regulatory protein pac2 [Candida maltosa Xu316]|uniref:cAMP-independent regulatory protein n=1 Tax=Candida maltosa (strain Xu316) TaxID=1245528 RepID=M3JVV0_CANMX|nr:hypothetical protein G210_3243 [Candida maltosa Xu316]
MLIISEFNPQLMQSDDSEEEIEYQFNENNSINNLNQVITYRGKIKSLYDALLIIESCRLQQCPIITRRLTGMERTKFIKPNTIFVWNETQCGMKRWTDGKLWSASKVFNGNFLIYKQLNKKTKKEEPNGLIKQSFSLVTKDNQRYHLISYYENDPTMFYKNYNGKRSEGDNNNVEDDGNINVPSSDSKMSQLKLSNKVYPDSLLNSVYKRKHQQAQQQQSQKSQQSVPIMPKPQQSISSTVSSPGSSSSIYSPIERREDSPGLDSIYSTTTNTTTSRSTTGISTPKSLSLTPLASIANYYDSKNSKDSVLPPPSVSKFTNSLMKDYDSYTVNVLNKGGWLK